MKDFWLYVKFNKNSSQTQSHFCHFPGSYRQIKPYLRVKINYLDHFDRRLEYNLPKATIHFLIQQVNFIELACTHNLQNVK